SPPAARRRDRRGDSRPAVAGQPRSNIARLEEDEATFLRARVRPFASAAGRLRTRQGPPGRTPTPAGEAHGRAEDRPDPAGTGMGADRHQDPRPAEWTDRRRVI